METLEWIARQEYLGRGILIGRTSEGLDFITYFVTGRSTSSRARKLVQEWEKDRVRTECTNAEQLSKGAPQLLVYDAMRRVGDVFVVSNGAQTDVIAEEIKKNPGRNPARILMDAFANPVWVPEIKNGEFTGNYIDLTSFEPDSPNWTPRISGVVKDGIAALSIAKYNGGLEQAERQYFEFFLIPRKARFISTYAGKNVSPGLAIPSFRGEPLEFNINMPTRDVETILERIYDYLGPKRVGEGIISPNEDFRVGISSLAIQRIPRPRIDWYTKNASVSKEETK